MHNKISETKQTQIYRSILITTFYQNYKDCFNSVSFNFNFLFSREFTPLISSLQMTKFVKAYNPNTIIKNVTIPTPNNVQPDRYKVCVAFVVLTVVH
jgi:hypothetical protein